MVVIVKITHFVYWLEPAAYPAVNLVGKFQRKGAHASARPPGVAPDRGAESVAGSRCPPPATLRLSLRPGPSIRSFLASSKHRNIKFPNDPGRITCAHPTPYIHFRPSRGHLSGPNDLLLQVITPSCLRRVR